MDYYPLRKRPGFALYWRSKGALLFWSIPGAAFSSTPRKPTDMFLTLQAGPAGGPPSYSSWLQARVWEPGWEIKMPAAAQQTGAGASSQHTLRSLQTKRCREKKKKKGKEKEPAALSPPA